MNYKQAVIYIQLAIILLLVTVILVILNQTSQSDKPDTNNNSILTNLDRTDFNRMNEMIHRFNEGKGDNLMVISHTFDSGPWIHDISANGREINWIVDNTRDGMSANPGKTEFVCKAIQMTDYAEYYIVELSKCKNDKNDEVLDILTFLKENL